MSDGTAAKPALGVQDLVAEWVELQPDAHAVRDPSTGKTLTYRELWRQAGRLAGDLVSRGVRPGDLVAVGQNRSIDLVVTLLGIVRAGAAYLPLDSQAPPDRLAAILDEASTDLVVCSSRHPENEQWRLPANVRRVLLPGSPPAGEDLIPNAVAGGDDPVYVAYTSGSTGHPKGVVVPHRAVIRLVVAPNFCTIAPGDRVANSANPAFDATTFEIWNTLTGGGTIVVFPSVTELTIDKWTDLMRAEDITTMFLTTSLFHMVARERPSAFRELHTLVVGGEQLDLTAAQRVLAAGAPRRLVNGYGPTETTTFATFFDCTAESLAALDRVPIGFAVQQTRLHVFDEGMRPVAAGEPGELCIGGAGVAHGYLHRPELTAERFVPEPGSGEAPASVMYRTGDVVRRLPGGALELLGRRDRQIKLRGFRIELEEVERAVLETGLVDSAFVEKLGDGPGAQLVAFVLPAHCAPVDRGELCTALADSLATRLPEYMIPARWCVLATLPFGPTGKIDRAQLIAQLAERPRNSPTHCDTDAVADCVARIWSEVLGGDTARGEDNFIESGGDSILAMRMASRISERLVVELAPADILRADSLAELTAVIRAKNHERVAV